MDGRCSVRKESKRCWSQTGTTAIKEKWGQAVSFVMVGFVYS